MKLIDPKVKLNMKRYVFQCSLATFAILVIFLIFDVLEYTTIVASLGATTFIIFTMPKSYASRIRPLIGGYIVGTLVGIFSRLILEILIMMNFIAPHSRPFVIFAALAVGLATFLMTLVNAEHPPAAGVAMALVFNNWNHWTIVFVLTAVIILAGIKIALKPVLKNLY